jgi:hypothetical protein
LSNQPPHRSHKYRGIPLEIQEFIATRRRQLSTQDDTNKAVFGNHTLDSEESEQLGIEFIDQKIAPSFICPLTGPLDPFIRSVGWISFW